MSRQVELILLFGSAGGIALLGAGWWLRGAWDRWQERCWQRQYAAREQARANACACARMKAEYLDQQSQGGPHEAAQS